MDQPLSQALPALSGSIMAGGAAEDLLRALTEHTPVGVFLSDSTGSCRFVNRRWCELTGLTVDQALGTGWAAALHPDDQERVAQEWGDAAGAGRDSVISYRFRRPDGSIVWIDGYASAFRDTEGDLVGWVGACLDVTSHQHAEARLRAQAETDALTGLPNRRALEDAMAAAVAHARAGGGRPSLVLLDIDHFKQINDTYGHPIGDDALRRIAQAIRARVREGDLPARLGGDEFAVLARTDNPEPLAEDLLGAIRRAFVEVDDVTIGVTASAGIASLADGESAEALLHAADVALYRAKNEGRNRAAGSLPLART